MSKFLRCAAIWVNGLGAILATSPSFATFYPNRGDLLYNSTQEWADTYFQFFSPGPWQNLNPAFEMDLVMSQAYYMKCVSFSNLPDPYDDCPTAGVLENQGERVFSFGSYSARQIRPTTYYGLWQFTPYPVRVQSTAVTLRGQELENSCPVIGLIDPFSGNDDPFDGKDPFCVGLDGNLTRGQDLLPTPSMKSAGVSLYFQRTGIPGVACYGGAYYGRGFCVNFPYTY